jgi:hypothetical protein
LDKLQEEDVNIRFEIDELSGKVAFLSDSNENIEIEIEGESGGSGGTVSLTIDSALSTTSTNPVQNKVITKKINEIENLIGNGTSGGGGNGTSLNIDTTLTVSGAAADAKTVGDKIGNLSDLKASDKSNLVNAINELTALGSPIRV